MSDRRTNNLSILMTDQLRAALEHAAERRFTTPSEYTRQALIEKMRADQIEPTQIQSAA
jgi:predicted transcriptional regulator